MFKNYNCIYQGVGVGLKQVAVVVCSRFLGSFPPLILYSDCNLEIHNLVKWHHDNTVLEKSDFIVNENKILICRCSFLPACFIVNNNKIIICRLFF